MADQQREERQLQDDNVSRLRQELNKPPGETSPGAVKKDKRQSGMTEAGERSALESGLPEPQQHPGDEERESGLARDR